MLAAVGVRRAWALVESGGNAIGFTTWTFSRRGDHWEGESAQEWSGFDRIPTSLQGLVSHVSLGAPPPPLRLPLENVDDRLRGDLADDGSPRLAIAIDGYAVYVLRHHASSPSTAAGNEIQAAHEGDRVITPAERVALRERLRLIRQASKPTSQAYATVGTILKALERDHPAGDRIATMERRRP